MTWDSTDYRFTFSWNIPEDQKKGYYDVEIEVIDSHGDTTTQFEGNKFQVVSENSPPDAPSSPTPSDGAVDVTVDSVLTWSCSDSDGDTLTYDVYLDTVDGTTQVASGFSVKTYDPGTMSESTTYYWKVVADDGVDQTESGVWSFTTVGEVSDWSASLFVCVGVSTAGVNFGLKDAATGEFDPDAGDEVVSPAPPSGVSVYFSYPDAPLYMGFLDITKLSVSYLALEYPANWTLKVETIGVSGESTINWTSSEISVIPSNYLVTLETPEGSVDMRSTSLYNWTAERDTTYTFNVTVSSCIEWTIEMSAGWNMVSIPVDTCEPIDIPGFYQLVTWTGTGYTPATVFEPGNGYWALVLEDTQIQLHPN